MPSVSHLRSCLCAVHPYKLYVNHNRTNIRYFLLVDRVVKMWNSLPVDIVDFSSLSRFQRSLYIKLILVNF